MDSWSNNEEKRKCGLRGVSCLKRSGCVMLTNKKQLRSQAMETNIEYLLMFCWTPLKSETLEQTGQSLWKQRAISPLYCLEGRQIGSTDQSHGCKRTLTPDLMNLLKWEVFAGYALDSVETH